LMDPGHRAGPTDVMRWSTEPTVLARRAARLRGMADTDCSGPP